MLKVECPKCKKRYALKGKVSQAAVKCGQCGAMIPLPETPDATRTALRHELSRLATADMATSSSASASRMHIEEEEDHPLLSSGSQKAVIVGAILLFLLTFGGGGFWLYWHITQEEPIARRTIPNVNDVPPDGNEQDVLPQPEPIELSDAAQAAWDAAEAGDEGPESAALALWQAAVAALEAETTARGAGEMLQEARQRITTLESAVANARSIKLAQIGTLIADAEARAADGKHAVARDMLKRAGRDLNSVSGGGDDVVQMRGRIQQVLASLGTKVVDNAGGPPPPTPGWSVLDRPSKVQRWICERWSDASLAVFALKGDGAAGAQYIAMTMKTGSGGKWVASLQRPVNLEKYDLLRMHMRVKASTSVALGLWVGSELFESRPQIVKKGAAKDGWREVTFNLQAADFKSVSSKWKYKAKVSDLGRINKISFLFYRRSTKPVDFCNLTVHRAD
jgi:hypothetical protein